MSSVHSLACSKKCARSTTTWLRWTTWWVRWPIPSTTSSTWGLHRDYPVRRTANLAPIGPLHSHSANASSAIWTKTKWLMSRTESWNAPVTSHWPELRATSMFRSSCNFASFVCFSDVIKLPPHVWSHIYAHFCYWKPAYLPQVQVDQVQFRVTRTFRTVSKPFYKTLYLVDFNCDWRLISTVSNRLVSFSTENADLM